MKTNVHTPIPLLIEILAVFAGSVCKFQRKSR